MTCFSPLCLGPLHGLANQEVLVWLTKVIEEVGPEATKDQLKDFLWKTLKSGQVKPFSLPFSLASEKSAILALALTTPLIKRCLCVKDA